MTPAPGRTLRDNAFLVAAVLLPVLVVSFFLLATAVPRWTVPPPAYDLLVRGLRPYDQTRSKVAYDIDVRDGQVQVTIRALPTDGYAQRPALFLVDHQTLNAREIQMHLPETLPAGDPPRVIVIDAVPGRRVMAQANARDGYALEQRPYHDTGILGRCVRDAPL